MFFRLIYFLFYPVLSFYDMFDSFSVGFIFNLVFIELMKPISVTKAVTTSKLNHKHMLNTRIKSLTTQL